MLKGTTAYAAKGSGKQRVQVFMFSKQATLAEAQRDAAHRWDQLYGPAAPPVVRYEE